MKQLSALLGAALFAWWPDHDNPGHPGSKFRPVMVLEVDEKRNMLRVAFGTSQKTDRHGPGEVVFSKDDLVGLTKDTKFCFSATQWMPMSAEYLSQTQGHGPCKLSILGRIPQHRILDVKDALIEAGGFNLAK